MIKGCQKRIIYLKSTDSPYFEEAYFIVNAKCAKNVTAGEMVKEAERIVQREGLGEGEKQKANKTKYLIPLLCISLCISLTTGIALLIGAVLS